MLIKTLLSTIFFLSLLLPLSAQETTVRVLFFTGNVTVKTSRGSQKAAIGQQLAPRDEVSIAKGGTLQLSINGKVIKYTQPAKVKVSEAIKRAGKGENVAVANTVRTLAAASGASREKRSSQAGATRATDSSRLTAKEKKRLKEEAKKAANDELRERTGIDDPLGRAEEIATMITGKEDMIILEPRATAVSSAPLRFRWLRSPTAGSYIVSVKNYLGEEVYHMETPDTAVTWDAPKLAPEAIYTWTLTDSRNNLHKTGALFHRLGDSLDATVLNGAEAIRRELGADNPALPIILAAFYADNGCYGEAARFYTEAALASSQHYDDLMGRACEQYQYQMYMQEGEMKAIWERF